MFPFLISFFFNDFKSHFILISRTLGSGGWGKSGIITEECFSLTASSVDCYEEVVTGVESASPQVCSGEEPQSFSILFLGL